MATKDPYTLSYLEILATSVAKIGVVPQHVAIIMDGNRRFARKNWMKIIQGHEHGAEKLNQIRSWGKAMGCKELTVFAFSTENFKRSKEEVDNLMELMFKKLTVILEEIESGLATDTCLEMIGNLDKIPSKLQYRMASIMEKTRYNKPYKLNIAVAYTGREGILRSLTSIPISVDKTDCFHLHPSQLREYFIDQAQHLSSMRPVDMLIRTGGDNRLSDFMMWETANAYIHFTSVSWPEVGFWDFIHAVFMFQVQHKKIQRSMLPVSTVVHDNVSETILEVSRTERWNKIAMLAKRDTPLGDIKKSKYEVDPIRNFITNLLSF